jgi:hypothetical protein
MYATCIHCQAALGSNDALEALPIGTRVAFDAKLGRLWVVCRHCERWNLAPFDERWEAIEQGERAFRDTRVRVSTDNIGLARLRDGTELVRVGAPLRPEFAAWRYGDQFGRRRRRGLLATAGVATGVSAGVGLAVSGAVATGIGIVAVVPLAMTMLWTGILSYHLTGGVPLRLPDGERVQVFGTPRIISMDVDEGWGLDLGCAKQGWHRPPATYRRAWFEGHQYQQADIERRQLRGNDALPLLRRMLLHVNRAAAPRSIIADGVQLIEEAGGPERFPRWASTKRHDWGRQQTYGDTGDIAYIPVAARLAFEMALHEDSERRAMDGELAELTRAWRDAEGVASIADSLLTPPAVQSRLDEMQRERNEPNS